VITSPTRPDMTTLERWPLKDERPPENSAPVAAFLTMLRRNWLLILACVLVMLGAVGFYTFRETPVFEASASIRIQDREPNLPDIYRAATTSQTSEIGTEIGVLSSRALKEDAAAILALQVYLTEPLKVARDELLRDIKVAPNAPVAEYRLTRRPDGRFSIFLADSTKPFSVSGPNGIVQLPGVSLVLTPAGSHSEELGIGVQSPADAVARLDAVSVSQPDRNANIVTLSYSDTDSLIVREVPNLITSRYLARRQKSESAEAGSTAQFLHEQLARVSSELTQAEEAFRQFREREHVLDPTVETSSGVSRLISKESERSSLEAERQALTKSLAEIDTAHAAPGAPSPYRRLIGLPFLLRNEAASAILSSLVSAENDKAALLSATSKDPDRRVLDAKIAGLEEQLRSITTTYLQGLANQVSSLDATLGTYGRELNTIPRKQLEYARLDRNVKSLETVYNLLQGRLNEAEIAVAVQDASIQVVDSAITPTAPSTPKPALNLAAALAVGLMLGIGLAFGREYQDKSVHSRHDVQVATGVPVLGLIPRIPKATGRIALITGKRKLGDPSRRHAGNGRRARQFTFLATRPVQIGTGAPAADQTLIGRATPSGLELTVSAWTNMVAEAYGLLVANISFSRTSPPTKVVVVTSPLAEDGKTTCAVNLAITLALRGSKTLLVDADLRRGVIHTALGSERAPGLSEVLSRSYPVNEAIRTIKVGEQGSLLHFLTTGAVPPNPSVLLESPGFTALIQRVKAEFDTVIVDSPPANIISDASVLGLAADGVLVVARSGVTESAALSHAVEQLTRVGVPLLGVVLNDIDFKRDAAYDSSYRGYSAASQYLKALPES
jgi:capsular exopolysaccharide synthesis family protein